MTWPAEYFAQIAADALEAEPMQLNFVKAKVSAADFLLLGSQPLKLLEAKPNVMYVPVFISCIVNFGTVAWDDITNLVLHLQYGDVPNTVNLNLLTVMADLDSSDILQAVQSLCKTSETSGASFSVGPTGVPADCVGKDVWLVLFNENTGDKTDLVAGDSEFIVSLAYIEQSLV